MLDDLLTVPEDGSRYEIIDGSLHVSPPLTPRHQLAATAVQLALHAAAPSDVLVLAGGAGIHTRRADRETEFLIPDVLIIGRDAAGTGESAFRPEDVVLVVEVVTPSSITNDLVTKRSLYALLGVPWYWIAELDPVRLTILRLHEGAYVEDAQLARDDIVELTDPFPIRVSADLLRA